jgi:hypothetical protein
LLGNASWQAALAVTATVAVMHFINRSKMLRQLKEAQSKLSSNTNTVKHDLRLMQNLIRTRIKPQYEGLIEVIDRLETGLAGLQSTSNEAPAPEDARERAFWLACALVEGRRYLEMEGGS